MKKVNIFFGFLFVSFFMIGCGQSAYSIFLNDDIYYKALKDTKKGEILDSTQTKVLVTAYYLNNIYKDRFNDDEHFLVALYIPDDFSKDSEAGINNHFLSILLKEQNIKSFKEVDNDEPILKELPMIERWSRYYFVDFNKIDERVLDLNISYKKRGSIVLNYLKDLVEK